MRLGGHRSGAPPRGRRDKNRSPPCQFKRIRPIRRVLRRTWRSRIKGGSDMAKGSPPARKSAAKRSRKPSRAPRRQQPKAAHPVSPLAPKSFVRFRRWRGPARHGRGGRPLQGPDGRASGRAGARNPGGGRLYHVEDGLRARRMVPRDGKGGKGAGAGRQQRQCQRLHGEEGHARRCATWPTWRPRPSAARPTKFLWRRPASSASRCRPNASPRSWVSSPRRARPTAGGTRPKRS